MTEHQVAYPQKSDVNITTVRTTAASIDPIDNPRDWIDKAISIPYGVWGLYFMAIGTGAAFFRYDSVYYDRRGIQESEIGLIKGLFPLSQAIGGFFFPRLADATRQHRIIIILTTLFTCLLWTTVAFKPIYSHTSMIMLISVLGGLLGGTSAPMIDAFASLMMRYNRSSYGMARLWSACGWGVTSFTTGLLLNRGSVLWMFYLYTSGQLCCVALLVIFYHLTRVEKRLSERNALEIEQHQQPNQIDDAYQPQINHEIIQSPLSEPHVFLPAPELILSEETANAVQATSVNDQPLADPGFSLITEVVDVVTHTADGVVASTLGRPDSDNTQYTTLLSSDNADSSQMPSPTASLEPEPSQQPRVILEFDQEVIPEGSLSPIDSRVRESDPRIQSEIEQPATRNQARCAAVWVLANLFVFGMMMSIVEYYLFLFAEKELDASTDLMGYATLVMTVSEIPWFWYADRILATFSLKWVFIVTEFSFGVRTLCYTFIPRSNPWLLLLLEPFHGMNFALMWSAAVQAGIHFAPKGVESSYQGAINAAYQGCGMAVGAIFGGFVFQAYGSIVLFRLATLITIVWCIILALFFPSHAFYRYRKHPFFTVPNRSAAPQQVSLPNANNSTIFATSTQDDEFIAQDQPNAELPSHSHHFSSSVQHNIELEQI